MNTHTPRDDQASGATAERATTFELQRSLQIATLNALMASRRWAPEEIAFQGGTCLHLAYDSPRFSEDLDFLVSSSIDLTSLGKTVQQLVGRTSQSLRALTNSRITLSKDKPNKNPRCFWLTLSADNCESIRLKIELWATPKHVIAKVNSAVRTANAADGPAAHVPAENPGEIYVDKIFAVASRTWIKPRDVFDIQWLEDTYGPLPTLSPADLTTRLDIYPGQTPDTWIVSADDLLESLPNKNEIIATDLKKWLPSYWPLDGPSVSRMVGTTCRAVQAAQTTMDGLERTRT